MRDRDNRESLGLIAGGLGLALGSLYTIHSKLKKGKKDSLPIKPIHFLDQLSNEKKISDQCKKDFLKSARISGLDFYNDKNINDLFIKENLLRNKRLTLAGVLVLTDLPRKEVKSAYIQFSKFEGFSKTNPTSTHEINGGIISQLNQSIECIQQSIKYYEIPQIGSVHPDRIYEYPMYCVQEALVNAICHRDYEDESRSTSVSVFNNRIEISNPGCWNNGHEINEAGKKTKIDLLIDQSVRTNPTLANALYTAAITARAGIGLDLMVADAKQHNAEIPDVHQSGGYIVTTIYPSAKTSFDAEWELRKHLGTNAQYIHIDTKSNVEGLTRLISKEPFIALNKWPLIEFETSLKLLMQCPWDEDHLSALVSRYLNDGKNADYILDLLLECVTTELSNRDIGCVLFAIESNKLNMPLSEYLKHANVKVRPDFFDVDLVNIPQDHGINRFIVGSNDDDNVLGGLERQEVNISPFRLSKCNVTCKMYKLFDTYKTDRCKTDDHPITEVSWWEAYLFCKWAGGYLPSEIEWEIACRAGTETKWWCGDNGDDVYKIAWIDEGEGEDADPKQVGLKKPNPWGLHDMHGNVWEWTSSVFEYERTTDRTTLTNESESLITVDRVQRGGAIISTANSCKSAARIPIDPNLTPLTVGFRLAKNVV